MDPSIEPNPTHTAKRVDEDDVACERRQLKYPSVGDATHPTSILGGFALWGAQDPFVCVQVLLLFSGTIRHVFASFLSLAVRRVSSVIFLSGATTYCLFHAQPRLPAGRSR